MIGQAETRTLAFSSRETLRLIEASGLLGSWGWTFATGEQVWSPGLFGLLGFEPGSVRPSYALFRDMIHPEDRPGFAEAGQMMTGDQAGDHMVRVIRADGAVRHLSSRVETYFAPDGSPRGAVGMVLDITDNQVLARAHAAEQQRRRLLFEQARCVVFPSTVETEFTSAEMTALTGIIQDEIAADSFHVIVSDEREHWRSLAIAAMTAERAFSVTPHFYLAGGGRERFHVCCVPVRDSSGTLREWINVAHPLGGTSELFGRVREGLEQAVRGRHLRAARALLGWSMIDLAAASGLSFSTIRRLEDDAEGPASRSRHRAIAVLREAGIRFSLMMDSTIAVARL